ncbi:MAG: hypothetical protein H0X37_19145 [Herpetosiphonaceae bacterium]|nr:hypothetical protein [Herpetosiphonaceae bacterium]
MYVRWIVRRHKSDEAANISFFDAYLVESYRDGRGVPRQRTMGYLGNVREIEGAFPAIERALFLIRATSILDSNPALSAFDRQMIRGMLQEKVPPLTEAELRRAAGVNQQWFEGSMKGAPDQTRRAESDLMEM